ncbi:MAG: 3',5'-cyclic-nucleotide phosphodiesterase [Nitrospirae bacterium]|nr:3',5'-cyclic-nucleotide phosphodiesterase [Nitrospirota bacterium]
MILRVLGSSGAEFPGYNPPAFLIDGNMLLDAGTIGSRLTEEEQWKIRNIFITHSHLDHIKGIPFLADNIVLKNQRHSVTVYGIKETLLSLRENLLNDKIWPDFTRISAAIEPVIKLRNIAEGKSVTIGDYRIRACRVNHTVPAVGYIIRDKKDRVLLYTGDTGPTDAIWKASSHMDAVIVEVSFPNSMEGLARKTGHLTAGLLLKELDKIKNVPEKIYITHPKPQYLEQIKKEIKKLGRRNIEMLKDGKVYEI